MPPGCDDKITIDLILIPIKGNGTVASGFV